MILLLVYNVKRQYKIQKWELKTEKYRKLRRSVVDYSISIFDRDNIGRFRFMRETPEFEIFKEIHYKEYYYWSLSEIV